MAVLRPPGTVCDQAVLFNVAGTLSVAPFAELGFSADNTAVSTGININLTVSLNKDSNEPSSQLRGLRNEWQVDAGGWMFL